uniref:Uncharacterized protein n=1 Tax=Aureoumbra lagunensis TaxID=44058 RepID=A0A7S3NNS4_9STRA|mmetsp:Transcript_1358/g.1758  ORF Transcript_1358/g.1758 Transcript_1358/m.1758 type:complete len:414 (+) Transcript_1358:27-1268(+)|eukprot:CAMPEP_0197302222 /NCGR_PEP_ID=MMETSP0890-20130614/50907_1 /TAXON_ID=44058 ORGANISM="Aureoumbra lagunensis, Strain CCMP1510" /NCGR_SAMPLE_ID=MMETSP0890 /ASSEMBLY_ACC=CAM_ASM_000533 /LENGTH=413 /DNA_ID=CAMNT_0042781757 /DNA_START=12 /DNA_END=1253 /DNA_ORIENTATION=+
MNDSGRSSIGSSDGKDLGAALDLLERVIKVGYDDAAIIDSVAAYRKRGRREIRRHYEALRGLREQLNEGPRLMSRLGKLGVESIKRHGKIRKVLSINDYERRVFHNAIISLKNVAQTDDVVSSDLYGDDYDDILLYVKLYQKEITQNDRFHFEFEPIKNHVEKNQHHQPVDKERYFEQAFKKRTHYKKVRYMSAEERAKFHVTISANGLLMHAPKTKIKQQRIVNVADAKYCLTENNELYIGHLDALNQRLFATGLRAQYVHPSFVPKNTAVQAAGRITVKDGSVLQFDNASSHFRPHLPSLTRFFRFLYFENRAKLQFPLIISYFPPGSIGGKNFGLLSPLKINEFLALDAQQNIVRVSKERASQHTSHQHQHDNNTSPIDLTDSAQLHHEEKSEKQDQAESVLAPTTTILQ